MTNTLYQNGQWMPTKVSFKKNLEGGLDFYFSRTALAQGHLNLSCWHGYQEVVYKKGITPGEIDFDFKLSENAYIVFEFNKDANQFSGIRLSLDKRFKNLYFISSDEGEFKYTKELNAPNVKKNTWNHAKIIFNHGAVLVYLNGQFIATIEIALLQQQHIAFRGGLKTALVDDVVIYELNSNYVIKEKFSHDNFFVFFDILGVIFLLNVIAGDILYIFLKNIPKHSFFLLITGNFVVSILLSAILLLDFFYVSGRYYPLARNQAIRELEREYYFRKEPGYILSKIKERYSDENPKNNIRVLFIGSSQTWGEGARNETETWVNRIEEKLNSSAILKGHFECINAGIPGAASSGLLDIYIKNWIFLEPKMVVINLSSNDNDPDQFAEVLRRFVNLNISKGIKTIFVLEANSIEERLWGLPILHRVMRQVGQETGVTVLDLHGYLVQNYDKGFLWWDSVHLTSFGQKLAADFLADKISRELLVKTQASK